MSSKPGARAYGRTRARRLFAEKSPSLGTAEVINGTRALTEEELADLLTAAYTEGFEEGSK